MHHSSFSLLVKVWYAFCYICFQSFFFKLLVIRFNVLILFEHYLFNVLYKQTDWLRKVLCRREDFFEFASSSSSSSLFLYMAQITKPQPTAPQNWRSRKGPIHTSLLMRLNQSYCLQKSFPVLIHMQKIQLYLRTLVHMHTHTFPFFLWFSITIHRFIVCSLLIFNIHWILFVVTFILQWEIEGYFFSSLFLNPGSVFCFVFWNHLISSHFFSCPLFQERKRGQLTTTSRLSDWSQHTTLPWSIWAVSSD